jgi:hypothetical protein
MTIGHRYVNGVELMYSVSAKRYSPPLLIAGNPFEYWPNVDHIIMS